MIYGFTILELLALAFIAISLPLTVRAILRSEDEIEAWLVRCFGRKRL